MLILSRKISESVIIKVPPLETEQIIKVMVVNIKSVYAVRLGVECAKEIKIDREEVLLEKKENK